MKKLLATLVAVPVLGLAGAALAAEPMQLSNSQMDSVTAGSASGAIILLQASATGSLLAFADTSGAAAIAQAPVIYVTPFGNVSLSAGTVLATGSSTSSN